MKNRKNFDYSKLKGRIREVFGSDMAFAKALGCSNNTMSAKTNNESDFTQSEIIKSVILLNLTYADIPQYFFTLQV